MTCTRKRQRGQHGRCESMHCLVTGGAGFIGSHLVDLLLESGHRVSVFDNFSSGRRDFLSHHGDNIKIIEGDLLDLDAVKAAMDGIDIVYHLAANPDIRLGTTVTDTDLNQGTAYWRRKENCFCFFVCRLW